MQTPHPLLQNPCKYLTALPLGAFIPDSAHPYSNYEYEIDQLLLTLSSLLTPTLLHD